MRANSVGVTPAAMAATPTPYLTVRPDRAGVLRLFCFHHAGGSASVFADWQNRLGPDVAVLPVQLPGRERRVREPRLSHMAELVRELDRHLDPYLKEPYAFYGHSMGGLVAWNLTMRRASTLKRLPSALLVGACNPPHLPPVSAGTRDMSRDQLLRWLVGMGGISSMVLKYPDWVDAALSLLRDDLALCDSHPHAEHRLPQPDPLPLPVHAFAGSGDTVVGVDVMAGWCRYGSSGEVHTVPGGHLFFLDSPDVFLKLLRPVLARLDSHLTPRGDVPSL
jgi:surfactin synthase thioesterase subunit